MRYGFYSCNRISPNFKRLSKYNGWTIVKINVKMYEKIDKY